MDMQECPHQAADRYTWGPLVFFLGSVVTSVTFIVLHGLGIFPDWPFLATVEHRGQPIYLFAIGLALAGGVLFLELFSFSRRIAGCSRCRRTPLRFQFDRKTGKRIRNRA